MNHMEIRHHFVQNAVNTNPSWCDTIFAAKAVKTGGIVRRAVRDVDREVGRDAFIAEVSRRRFHLIENNGQYIIICNREPVTVLL